MATVGLNHVSVCAPDMEASIAFYEDLFGAERLPTPNFGYPVQWLRLGAVQLHLFDRPEPAREYAHFGITVDDMDAVYTRARELGALDFGNFGHCLFELPGDCVQLYLRDPGGTLVEADAAGVERLSPEVRADVQPLTDHSPQSEENLRATLFLGGRA
jgi:catechol 2,3-dioxygenase-like lactoylglutathione lyase family enzyme